MRIKSYFSLSQNKHNFQIYPECQQKLVVEEKLWEVMAHTCNPSTQEAEVGRLLQVQGQPELHGESELNGQTLSPKKKRKEKTSDQKIK